MQLYFDVIFVCLSRGFGQVAVLHQIRFVGFSLFAVTFYTHVFTRWDNCNTQTHDTKELKTWPQDRETFWTFVKIRILSYCHFLIYWMVQKQNLENLTKMCLHRIQFWNSSMFCNKSLNLLDDPELIIICCNCISTFVFRFRVNSF